MTEEPIGCTNPEREMKNKYDVVIVGAGVAGLTLVEKLTDSGLKILLLDRKNNVADVQYITSASLINPKKWKLLSSILHPLCKCSIRSKNQSTFKRGQGFFINRKKLLKFLESKAQKNKNLKIHYW